MNDWIKLTVKHSNTCIECGKWIMQDEEALWMQGLGIKHIECPTGIIEDNSELVVIEEEDKQKLGWK